MNHTLKLAIAIAIAAQAGLCPQAADAAAVVGRELPDPKDRIKKQAELQLASFDLSRGQFVQAETRLRVIVNSDPGNITARCRLADARAAQNDLDDAATLGAGTVGDEGGKIPASQRGLDASDHRRKIGRHSGAKIVHCANDRRPGVAARAGTQSDSFDPRSGKQRHRDS